MQIEDMFLHVTEPAKADGSQRKQRRYEVRSRTGMIIGIEDVAARIGRKPASVYQLLRNLPLGIHGMNFQDIMRKSAARQYHRKTVGTKLVMAHATVQLVEAAFVYNKHDARCAVERHRIIEARQAAEGDRWLEQITAWRESEQTRKLRRASGETVPVVQPPERPKHPFVPSPACDCGRDAAIDAARVALGESTISEQE